MHRREKRATCLFCGQRFNDPSDLYTHSASEHVRTRNDFP